MLRDTAAAAWCGRVNLIFVIRVPTISSTRNSEPFSLSISPGRAKRPNFWNINPDTVDGPAISFRGSTNQLAKLADAQRTLAITLPSGLAGEKYVTLRQKRQVWR
jgi:hypothetical protein